MANDGSIKVISKLKPDNDSFKLADASDIEYPSDGAMNINKNIEEQVTNTQAAIDTLYEIINAKPTFYLFGSSRINSDGNSRVTVKISTFSKQGNGIKIVIENKTLGTKKIYSDLPREGLHDLDLGVISTTGIYDFVVTATDSFGNRLLVDKSNSCEGSFNTDLAEPDQLIFSVIVGTVNLSIENINIKDKNNNDIKTITVSDIDNINKISINIEGKLNYPETGNNISQSIKYNITTREVYLKTSDDEYISAHKYIALLNNDIQPNTTIQDNTLYYHYISKKDENEDKMNKSDGYISISEYNKDQSKYNLSDIDSDVGILYNFIKNDKNTGEFIYHDNKYELRNDSISEDTYDFLPSYIETDIYDIFGNKDSIHDNIIENIQFTINNLYFLNESKYSIVSKAIIRDEDSYIEEYSSDVISNIYPIYEDNSEGNNKLKVVIKKNIDYNITTDDNIDISFIIIPETNFSNINNVNFNLKLDYFNKDTNSWESIRDSVKENYSCYTEIDATLGRPTSGKGVYRYTISPTTLDGTINGEFEYTFNVLVEGNIKDSEYVKNGLVAYWSSENMYNDMKNPDIWYPMTVTDNNKVVKTENIYIKLFGLNYVSNGWIEGNKDKNIPPHIKFTGDSYGLAYRKNSDGSENPLSVMDLLGVLNGNKDKNMTFEIMFRTRCIGEMSACVLSSRKEESSTSYSDYDSTICNPGVTISHNKAIVNSNINYLSTPFNEDEWKHVTFVINNSISDGEEINGVRNYNPFSSMRIYINGVLTSMSKITNDKFNNTHQMVLNAHLDDIVKNFGSSEIQLIRMYNIALSSEQIVKNYIDSIYDDNEKNIIKLKNDTTNNTIPIIYFLKNDDVEGKGSYNTDFNYLMSITEKGPSKQYFVNCTMKYYYRDLDNPTSEMLHEDYNNVDVFLQGTSTLQYPVKNLKIKTYENTNSSNKSSEKIKIIPPNMKNTNWIADSTYTLKCDYMESGHIHNTPTAKFYDKVVDHILKMEDISGERIPLHTEEYIYTKGNDGKYFLDKDGIYKEIDLTDEEFTGNKFNRSRKTSRLVASPSKDYFEAIFDNNIIHRTNGNEDITKNKYYIRKYNDDYTALEWVAYNPADETHHNHILYKLVNKYKDAIDGFPCIVYYSNTSKEFSPDNPNNKLLGTMMFNVDKSGKALGFETSPIYENEYNEYLYSKYITLKLESSYNKFNAFIQAMIENYDDIDEDIRNNIYTFNEFYNIDDGKDINTETLVPSYLYDQEYIEDPNGDYVRDDSGKYIFRNENNSINDTFYKLKFNDYRTYNINDNKFIGGIKTSQTISYEAKANSKYNAGTFYKMNESYEKTYNDDYLNLYYNTYFHEKNNSLPRYVYIDENKIFNEERNNVLSLSPIINSNTNIVESVSIDIFKSYFMGNNPMYKIDVIPEGELNSYSKNCFYIEKNNPGPYVYISNGVVSNKDTIGIAGEFKLYNPSEHGTVSDELRYKFGIPIYVKNITYVIDPNGEYYYENKIYIKADSNTDISKERYSILYSEDFEEFRINDKLSYTYNNSNGDDESYIKYISESFEPRYSYIEENESISELIDKDKYTYNPMKRLLHWISDNSSNNKKFKEEFSNYFDLSYAITYYLQMIVFGQADNAGKNSMWDTWDGKKFYIRPYDMDTQAGLNNKGYFVVPSSAEINIEQSPRSLGYDGAAVSNWESDPNSIRYKESYTTTSSLFWNSFALAFKDEIRKAYISLRQSGIYTKEFIYKFFKDNTSDIIGEIFYNSDMESKYISLAKGSSDISLDLLSGNRIEYFNKWMNERIIFCDTYFDYTKGVEDDDTGSVDTLNSMLDIRAQKSTSITIGISVFSPQYVKINLRSNEDHDLIGFVDNKGITYFTFTLSGTNNEIRIYGGGNIKELIDINLALPSYLDLRNAEKILSMDLTDNKSITSLNLKNAKYLRELNLNNATSLSNILDISNCINLQKIDISYTKLSGVILPIGGNLKSFTGHNTLLSNIEFNNLMNLTDINIDNDGTDSLNKDINISEFSIIGSPLIKYFDFNKYKYLRNLNIDKCESLYSIMLQSNKYLENLNIRNCDNLSVLNMKYCTCKILNKLDLSTVYGLDVLNIENCKYSDGINVILPYYKNSIIANMPIENIEYDNRWHKLKTLLCKNSDIQSISYGNKQASSNNDTLDMSQLTMLTTPMSFYACKKIENLHGLKFKGPIEHYDANNSKGFLTGTSIKNITDTSLEFTGNDTGCMGSLFNNCSNLDNFMTLNIDPYTFNGNITNLNINSVMRSTNNMSTDKFNSIISYGREYILEEITDKNELPETLGYNCQNYLVKDITLRYTPIEIITDVLYVKDIDNQYREYDAEKDNIDTKTYFKGSDNKYYSSEFGIYIYDIIDDNTNKYYINIDPTSVITLVTDDDESKNQKLTALGNITNLNSDNYKEGNIAKKYVNNNVTYYRYFNGKWRLSKIFTYNNINIGNTRNNTFYKVYNPENHKDLSDIKIYKKIFKTDPKKYITNINSSFYNAKGTINTESLNFDGLENITSASYTFYSSDIKINDNNTCSEFSKQFKKLNKLNNCSGMFAGCRNITYLPYDMFNIDLDTVKNIENGIDNGIIMSAMFYNCSNLIGFIDSNGNKMHYKITNINDIDTKRSILPLSVTNTSFMFDNCTSLNMSDSGINDILIGLTKVRKTIGMFERCTNLDSLQNYPLGYMYNLEDCSSMFARCSKLKINFKNNDEHIESIGNNKFKLFLDQGQIYNNKIKARSLFYNCKNITGCVDSKLFGNAAEKITHLGYDNSNHTSSAERAINYGAFSNTGIESYTEDFLNNLVELEDISFLFARISSDGNFIMNSDSFEVSENNGICYYYDKDQINKYGGIPKNLFNNNTKLINVSYIFAGNRNIFNDSNNNDINFDQELSLPNLFKECNNIKYMIGTFMGLSNLDDNIVYIDIDEFFKGKTNLISVESLFEDLNCDIKSSIPSNIFSDCNILESTKNMFKDNKNLLANNDKNSYIIPIEIFNSCRKKIKNTSGMFAGCSSMIGTFPTGDNTLLVLYNNYLNNIKNDPDIEKVDSSIKNRNVENLFDYIYNNNLEYTIGYDINTNNFINDTILSFDKFIEKYKGIYKNINNESLNINYGDIIGNLYLQPTEIIYAFDETNKHKYSSNNALPIKISFNESYIIDRISVTLTKNNINTFKNFKKIISSFGREELANITDLDIGDEPVSIAIFDKIGEYSIDIEAMGYEFLDGKLVNNNANEITLNNIIDYNNILEFPEEYIFNNISNIEYNTNLPKFVKQNIFSCDSSNIDMLSLLKTYNVYKAIKDNNGNYNFDNNPIDSINRRIIPYTYNTNNNNFSFYYSDNDHIRFIMNGTNINNINNDYFYILYPSINYPSDDPVGKPAEYIRGILGSCKNLENCSSMFAGCKKIYGAVPKDIFSSESENNNLTALTDISSMFKGCVSLATNGYPYSSNDGKTIGNTEYMYSDKSDINNIYLVPKDWLKYVINLNDISYLFSRIAFPIESTDIGNNSTSSLNDINNDRGFITLHDDLFTNNDNRHYKITNSSYFLFGSPYIEGKLTNNFLKYSLNNLDNIEYMFTYTSLSSVGKNSINRIFESINSSKLKNAKGLFYGCTKIKDSYLPRFNDTKKFNNIEYNGCFTAVNKNNNSGDSANMLNDDTNAIVDMGIWLFNTTPGYYTKSTQYDKLTINFN